MDKNFLHSLLILCLMAFTAGAAKSQSVDAAQPADLVLLGHDYFDKGMYAQSLESYSAALDVFIINEEYIQEGNSYIYIGKVYLKLDMHRLSLQNFEQAATKFKEHELTGKLAEAYNYIGKSYANKGDYDIAMQYYNDVLDLPADSVSPFSRAFTYSNIAAIFLNRGDIRMCTEFMNRAMGFYSRANDSIGIAGLHIMKGNLDRQAGDLESALQEYTGAYDLFLGLEYKKGLAEATLLQAETNLELLRVDEALRLTNYAMSIGQEYGFLEIIKDCYLLLSNIYSMQDDIHRSHAFYLQYNALKDSIYNTGLSNLIAKIEIRNAFHRHGINVDQLEEEERTTRNTRWIIIIFHIFLLTTVILALSRILNQRKANRILAHQRNILKKTLSEQRISEMKYKQLFSLANDSIFLMDHETFKDCNDKTLEMFGCSRKDIIGQPPYKFSPENQPDGKSSKDKALELIDLCYKGKPQRFYWLHTRLDGSTFDAEVSLNVISLEGTPYVQAIVRDISERVSAEQEMVQAREKAEKATQSKTFFLAKMSHEIRTMLGGITSSSQLLKSTRVDKNQKELLDIINNSADNLLAIVNEILDLSKIEAGKVEIESRAFDLRKTLENTVNAYQQKAKEKKIALYLSIHPKTPEMVNSDELRIKQILANLISNAIKFTDKGNVTCEVSVIREYKRSYLVSIKVSDTGIGIPQNKIKDMFAEYSQSDVSTSRKYGGTGLGLNIVYKLINLMQGTIEVSSELNVGTQFIANLSLQKTDPDDKPGSGVAQPKLRAKNKYKILLAEDNLVNQRITIINLQNLGYTVDLAEDGYLTWEKYLKEEYDVILMDVQMPEMDGIEVTRMIRKYEKDTPDKARTRIIAITANIHGQDAEFCLSAGMDAYIAKPFKIEDILEKIEPEEPAENGNS